ncbi:hypothetical protein LTR56_014742 [Elasticomyces elasticus]|nr:hypothetical protein LTR56_014742 [Elasticomyces elasticus]KAK3645460.1 hypothetical protein LTR22_014722 [Elasticomyces elasticus]KAK4915816.1 hypothetical protein LTR49_016074 [Elasticomyces elasticus]KAK5755588.1 hypothetical protein LTS12_014344 [Elasticomyces elasticus]
MATSDPIPQELSTYLATCSSEHADQIIQALREANQRNATRPTNRPTPATHNMVVQNPVIRGGKRAKQPKPRVKKSKIDGVSGGPKRPLNSWMAFRKYYNASLSPHTQKAISKILMTWWRDDPFSAKWAILAKAYSILRGCREKEDAPLDHFLALAVPLMGIVPPEHYQSMMGWQLIAASDGDQDKAPKVVRFFQPDFTSFDTKYTLTTLSVDDLVEYCMGSGYLNDASTRASVGDAQGSLTMAVQPATTATATTAVPANLNITVANNNDNDNGPMSPFSASLAHQLGLALGPGYPAPPPAPTALAAPVAPVAPAAQVMAATINTSEDKSGYPYNGMFDPTAQFNITFNPLEETVGLADGGIYDAFDPSASMSVDDMLNLDWSQFVNDDSTA